jgi:Arc/MetJ family transcription regulator
MRTNIVIDDQLMRDAMQASGARTKREAVEIGLRTLVRLGQQQRIKALRGRLPWEGDLASLRLDQTLAAGEQA